LMVCLLGVVYPIFSELLTGTVITVGPRWYERIIGTLFLLLLFMMGLCPLAGWGGSKLKKMGKGLIILVSVSLVIPIIAWFAGDIRNAYVLVAFWLAGSTTLMILGDFLRGVTNAWRGGRRKGLSAFLHPIGWNRVRMGGMLVHFGVVLMGVGIIGIEGLQQETQVSLMVGDSVDLGKYQFQYEGLEPIANQGNVETTQAVLAVSRDGVPVLTLYPQRQIYYSMGLAITQPTIDSSLARDLYAILVNWDVDMGGEATFRIYINPLINWLWIVTGILTLGVCLAVWPGRLKKYQTQG